MQHLIDRFLRYVKIDSQSDPNSNATPSTQKQWDMARLLAKELKEIGLEDVTIDERAYVMATLPSNVDFEVPVIGFISHFDTSPDYSATNVKPKVIENYNGKDIVLNAEKGIILSPSYFQELLLYKGQTLIVTDGTTLLGADDKAGITEIVTAMEFLVQSKHIKHGKVRVGFTPDEEIGRGAHYFNVEKFGAAWAYTMDGGQLGELEFENFNAASLKVTFNGTSVHPGYAKGKMVNAVLMAHKFLSLLPQNEIPERTENREGFFHLHTLNGQVEQAEILGIIRDHDKEAFAARKELISQIVADLNAEFGAERVNFEIKDQYYNMREKIEPVMHIVEIAQKAMEAVGVKPIIKPIRGGTDGSQLSFKGLPCPNIFAGGHNFHGCYEFIPVESMVKASETIIKICELVALQAEKKSR